MSTFRRGQASALFRKLSVPFAERLPVRLRYKQSISVFSRPREVKPQKCLNPHENIEDGFLASVHIPLRVHNRLRKSNATKCALPVCIRKLASSIPPFNRLTTNSLPHSPRCCWTALLPFLQPPREQSRAEFLHRRTSTF